MVRVFTGPSYPSILKQALAALLSDGTPVSPRGRPTREIQHVGFSLADPLRRFPRIPHRNANIFALVAETLWVFAGRNDLAFIQEYLPRMTSFSDDGVTLSGAYGPRLRDYSGVDQLHAAIATLLEDGSSRRAAISLFDPALHHDQSKKDIPCCTSLHFTQQDHRLNLCVYSRSMDIMWGSAINFFEWTLLQEAAALWLNLSLGTYTHVVGSLHVYEEFLPRAEKLVRAPEARQLPVTQFDLPLHALDGALADFFRAEARLRSGLLNDSPRQCPSAWLLEAQILLRAYWIGKLTRQFSYAKSLVRSLPQTESSDMALAQLDFMARFDD